MIKLWNLSSLVPNFKLKIHEGGFNCVYYYNGGEKPYLVTRSDDKSVKMWDCQTKACVQSLEGRP